MLLYHCVVINFIHELLEFLLIVADFIILEVLFCFGISHEIIELGFHMLHEPTNVLRIPIQLILEVHIHSLLHHFLLIVVFLA